MIDWEKIRKWKKVAGLARLQNTRGMILFYLLGLRLSGSFQLSWDIFSYTGMFLLVYINSSLSNHLLDKKTDRINKRRSSLAFVKIKKSSINKTNIIILLIIFVLGLSVSNLSAFYITFGTLFVLGYLYSSEKFKLSHTPFGKSFLMIANYSLIPGFAGLLRGGFSIQKIVFMLLLAVFYFSFMVFSDIKDMKGDLDQGKKTLAVVLGIAKLSRLTFFISVFSGIGIILNILQFFGNPTVLIVILLILMVFQLLNTFNNGLIMNKTIRVVGSYFLLLFLLILVSSPSTF